MATVGALAAGVAHEINNPLTAIIGFAEGLRRRIARLQGQVDPELYADFEEYTETIIKECLRCRDIVQTLLTFSRPVASSASARSTSTSASPTPCSSSNTTSRSSTTSPVKTDLAAAAADDPRRRVAAETGDHQPDDQRLRCHRLGGTIAYHTLAVEDDGVSWSSKIPAAASRWRCRISCSSRSSPPSRSARGSASACRPVTPSSRTTAARSASRSEVGRGSAFRVSLPGMEQADGQRQIPHPGDR